MYNTSTVGASVLSYPGFQSIHTKRIRMFMKLKMLAIAVFALGSQLLFANPARTGRGEYGKNPNIMVPGKTVDGSIQGKVTNENGDPVSGATVSLENTKRATVANEKGEFVIENVKSGNFKLKITAVGYQEIIQDVKVTEGTTNISFTLIQSKGELGEVVVTALGIRRQARTLTYATQKVSGEQINEVKSGNIANSLSGRVAGVVITQSAYGPGSAAKILLRGNRSIGGGNGALIVVDGAIIDNSIGGAGGADGISSINPDDVENINVLKGSSATALYGTKGANGVILITTKRGRSGQLSVNFNSGVTWDSPLLSPEVQNDYGQGGGGVFGPNAAGSWGPKISGQQVTDWTGKQITLAAQPDNLKGFFRDALSTNNSIGISGGTDITQTYFSYGNLYSQGIVPQNELKRHTVNLRITSKLGKHFSMDSKVTYVHQDITDKPGVIGTNSAPMNIYKIPRTVRLEDVKNYKRIDSIGNVRPNYWYTSAMFGNPYWTVYNTHAEERRDRIIGLITGKYQITSWLDLQATISLDLSDDKGSGRSDANSVGSAGSSNGSFGYGLGRSIQRNVDVVLSGKNNISNDFKVSYNLGGTLQDNKGDYTNISVRGLIIPNRFNLAFAADQFNSNSEIHVQRQAVFGTTQFSFRDFLYLDITARQEYFSTLPPPYYSFYPSTGLSAILSDMFKMPTAINYSKIRVGYARTGGGGPGFLTKQTYSIYPGGLLQRDAVSPFPDLKPELTTGWEAGTEWRFLENRLSVDFTWYKSNTTNQLLRIPTPPATGFASQYINAGNIQNTGVEVVLNITPLKQPKGLTWDIGVNYARNTNKVISILPGSERVEIDGGYADFMIPVVKVDGAYGDIYAFGWKKNASGEYVIDANGRPVRTEERIKVGNYNPKFTLGVDNSFSYKKFVLNFLVDGRFGGEMVSASDAVMAADGTPAYTTSHREPDSWILPGVHDDGSKNTTPINAEAFWTTVSGGRNAWSEEFIYDATNVRLREFAIGYKFTRSPFAFIKEGKISLVARNVFFFYRGYAKVDLPGIAKRKANFDSEVNLYNSNMQGLEYGTLPPTRSIGINLKLSL
ncbi:MAG: SusC/RagA family TonB-linked outer membrane protein [Ferruginibacter sp.]